MNNNNLSQSDKLDANYLNQSLTKYQFDLSDMNAKIASLEKMSRSKIFPKQYLTIKLHYLTISRAIGQHRELTKSQLVMNYFKFLFNYDSLRQ